jgi:hypothetical protein
MAITLLFEDCMLQLGMRQVLIASVLLASLAEYNFSWAVMSTNEAGSRCLAAILVASALLF